MSFHSQELLTQQSFKMGRQHKVATRLIVYFLLLTLLLVGCSANQEATPVLEKETLLEVENEVIEDTKPEIEYEEYTGQVPHIFIHTLIAYPEKKRSDGNMIYDSECINVTEFKNLLNELYANGYCLVDIHDTFGKTAEGKLQFYESVEVVKGKKPVMISIDDVVYDYRKRGNGMVDLLALNENNDIVAGTYEKDGSITYSKDNEFVPILETFIETHPDFSTRGARMTLAMTGFAGTFGYRTDTKYTGDRQGEIQKAKAVADRLKEMGYTFASHSFAHRDVNKHTEESMGNDLERFQEEVVPIIGDVSVYVYPYGKLVYPKDSRYKAAQKYGMELFCSVSHEFFQRNYEGGDTLYMQRVAVDGYSLRRYKAVLAPLFDVDKVIDKKNRV